MPKVKPRFKEESPRHFIREWRKFRGLTQARLGDRIGVTHGALSQLERGETGYTQPMLEALAYALRCTPADLVGRPPEAEFGIASNNARLVELLRGATPDELRRVEQMVELLLPRRTGTDG